MLFLEVFEIDAGIGVRSWYFVLSPMNGLVLCFGHFRLDVAATTPDYSQFTW